MFDHSDVGRCHGGIGFQVGVEEWIGKDQRHAIIRDRQKSEEEPGRHVRRKVGGPHPLKVRVHVGIATAIPTLLE